MSTYINKYALLLEKKNLVLNKLQHFNEFIEPFTWKYIYSIIYKNPE